MANTMWFYYLNSKHVVVLQRAYLWFISSGYIVGLFSGDVFVFKIEPGMLLHK